MSIDTTKEYVYDGTTVVLTGRVARRKASDNPTRKRIAVKEDVMVEIKTTKETVPSWSRWVKQEELYEVTSMEQ